MYGCLWFVWSTWSAINSRFPRVASLTSSLGYCRVRTRAPIFGSVALPPALRPVSMVWRSSIVYVFRSFGGALSVMAWRGVIRGKYSSPDLSS